MSDEMRIRSQLDNLLSSREEKASPLRRLRAKLELRRIKRSEHLKLFDLDAFTNELMDRERAASSIRPQSRDDDDDVIFEYKTFKANAYEKSADVIEIDLVLNRFKKGKDPDYLDIFYPTPIGMVGWRNDDIKCILSPFTNKYLKYINEFK